jgi:hypothetical protein
MQSWEFFRKKVFMNKSKARRLAGFFMCLTPPNTMTQ